MGTIYCLMGKSASGKDFVYKNLLLMPALHLKEIVTYTTRPIRFGEVEGKTYFFRTEEEAAAMAAAGKIIELRAYDTVHGIWKYFTADDGQIDLTASDYLQIGTLEAYEKLRDYFGAEKVCPLYVWVEDGERLGRALRREKKQEMPKYAELCRRFLADEADFAEEKLQRAGIVHRFDNLEKEQIVADVAAFNLARQQAAASEAQ